MGQILDKIYYSYNDVTIMPGVISEIEHRSECNPYDEEDMLPLFTAPMDTVVDKKNFNVFEENKIHAILPRTESVDDRIAYACDGKWAAFSLNEFEELFTGNVKSDKKMRVLIDIANGHMAKILEVSKKAKEIYGDDGIEIMAGNIANPETYLEYAKAGIDYVRCSIGTGCGCLSSSNTGVHVPPATLINDIAEEKLKILGEYYGVGSIGTIFRSIPKIIADGGIRNYKDPIKALALGADYVMIGSVFTKMLESAAPKHFAYEAGLKESLNIDLDKLTDFTYENGNWYAMLLHENRIKLGFCTATFYGMASKEGQIALNGEKTKTSEGIMKTLPVEYTMKGWITNFTDYLRSAMSYTGFRSLENFKNYTKLVINSQNAVNAVNK